MDAINAAGGMLSPADASVKLAIALGIGMLVGLEREWAQKDLETRTFAITAMLGTLGMLANPAIAYIAFGGVLVVIAIVAIRNVSDRKPVEATTSAALILTFVLGVLVGLGHQYTPVAAAIVMTMLLSLKPALTHFTGGLKVNEVRGAVLLGLLGFVIYPVLPNRFVDPWQLVNPREAWLTVIIIAALGFVNYVLLKLYSSRGLYYTAVLGGLVNSTATIAELGGFFNGGKDKTGIAIVIDLLTVLAMFLRNLVILAIFARAAVTTAVFPMVAMASISFFLIWKNRRSQIGPAELQLSSPVSLPKVLNFGLLFLLISIVGTLGQRYLGHFGFLLVSAIGGLASSASTTGAAAVLAMHGSVTPQEAGIATVLTSMASALSNLPLIYKEVHQPALVRKLTVLSLGIVATGVVTMLILIYLRQ
jgi:uncharacterized membrane protein (DUF4010 family)